MDEVKYSVAEYDIYELIHSQEIRAYFRKTWKMGIKEQVQLVALSYEDIREKVKILRWIAEEFDGSEEDKTMARSVSDYLEFCYKAVTAPNSEAIYLLDWVSASQISLRYKTKFDYYEDMVEGEGHGCGSVNISFEEIMRYLKEYYSDEDTYYKEAIVEMFELPMKAGKEPCHNSDWAFYLAQIHGNWVIRRIEGDKDWLLSQGFSEDTLDMVNYFMHSSMFDHHFTLPFERGCRVKLQTPIMREPLIGIFDPYYQDFEHKCHYVDCENFMYICREDSFPVEKSWEGVPEGEKVNEYSLAISYHMIPPGDDGFSIFDWLERA